MRTQRCLAAAATLFAVACGDEISPSSTVAATTVCTAYPVHWPADADAETAARAELARLDPKGSLSWDADRGTLQSVSFGVPLRCLGHADAITVVRRFLAENPALFHFDDSEWRATAPFECRQIPEGGTSFTIGRERLGEHELRKDILAFDVKRVRGKVQLTSVQAFYLPTGAEASAAGVDEQLTACDAQTPEALESTVRATPLRAALFSLCIPQGSIFYTPQPNDLVDASPPTEWDWFDTAGEAQLFGTRRVRVTVDPANYTPELLSSSARCPVLDVTSEDFTVGFDVFIDANTGEIQFVKAGLDCIVC